MTIFKHPKKKRIIDLLRKHVPGKWHYEWPSRWVHESGVAVQAYSSCSISVSGFESYSSHFRRSDTGEVVYPLLGHGLEKPFVPPPPPGPSDFRPL